MTTMMMSSVKMMMMSRHLMPDVFSRLLHCQKATLVISRTRKKMMTINRTPLRQMVAAENRNGKRVSIDQPDNNGSKTQKRARTNIVTGKQTAMSQKPPRSAQQTARSRGASRASNSSNSILDSAMNARQSSPLPMDNSHQQQADTRSTSPLSRRSMANSSATDWFQHQLLFAEYLEGQDEIFQVKSNLVADTQAELSLFMKHVNTEIKRGNNNRR